MPGFSFHFEIRLPMNFEIEFKIRYLKMQLKMKIDRHFNSFFVFVEVESENHFFLYSQMTELTACIFD